jgi:D-alanine-D-alanine ligase
MALPAVIFGGPSPEHDISVSTGLQVTHVLGRCHALYWAPSGSWFAVDPGLEPPDFADGAPRKAREAALFAAPGGGFVVRRRPLDVSVVVNCLHGGPGEDGTLQGAMDLAGIRYTGPGVAASALGMDKYAFGAAIASAGLPTLPRVMLAASGPPPFDPPYIVKPRFGGSSIGIEVVADHETALALLRTSPHLAQGAVVEPFLDGSRDLQIGVRTYPELGLSAIEEPARVEGGIYSYQQKYLAWGDSGRVERKVPAPLEPDLEAEIRSLATAVAGLAGLRSVARIDFLEQRGRIYVNEVNTIPGSLAAYLWIDPPVSRERLVADLIAEAEASPPRTFSTAGADGVALRNAGTIASKLG